MGRASDEWFVHNYHKESVYLHHEFGHVVYLYYIQWQWIEWCKLNIMLFLKKKIKKNIILFSLTNLSPFKHFEYMATISIAPKGTCKCTWLPSNLVTRASDIPPSGTSYLQFIRLHHYQLIKQVFSPKVDLIINHCENLKLDYDVISHFRIYIERWALMFQHLIECNG